MNKLHNCSGILEIPLRTLKNQSINQTVNEVIEQKFNVLERVFVSLIMNLNTRPQIIWINH